MGVGVVGMSSELRQVRDGVHEWRTLVPKETPLAQRYLRRADRKRKAWTREECRNAVKRMIHAVSSQKNRENSGVVCC